MKLKILPVPFPYNVDPSQSWLEKEVHKEIQEQQQYTPVMHREGLYFDRDSGISWVETPLGECYEYDSESFHSELKTFNASELRPEQINGLKNIVNCNLATPKQKKLWWNYVHYVQLRNVSRNSRKFANSI